MYEEIKTACIYARYSSNNQTEQSIEGQLRVCREFCNRYNIRIVEIYTDRATSASKDIEKRVSFLKMIKDSEKGNFDAVIVYKLDRFARSRYDSATYKYRLRKNGVQLISATENISNDPEGIILESVLEGMAEFYSAELSQKIHRGLRESAYKHNSIGGQIPLGYKTEGKKLVIDEETAPIVREAFEMYAEGHSVADICRTFNAKGYKTSKGTRFGKSSFSKIFRNEKYIGVYQFHDYRAEDAIPALIDRKTFNLVQARLKSVGKAPGQFKAKHIYLLSGKLYCGHCGCKMNGNCNTNEYSYYECYGKKNLHKDCHKRNLRKDFIEDIVVRDALSLLTPERIEEIATVAIQTNTYEVETTTDIPAIRGRLHETKLSLENITKAIEGGLAPETLVKRMVELEKEKKVLEGELKKEEKGVTYLDKEQVIYWLNQFKDGDIEDEDFRRQLIDLFVNSVTVWDEPDDFFKITIAYNLTSLQEKTYRLPKGGTLSDLELNAPDWEATKKVLLTHPGYTAEDRAQFLNPLLAALDEAAPRYLRWRQTEMQRCAAGIEQLRARLEACPVLAAMVRHTGKRAVAYLSCSLPRNGRGIMMQDALCAMAAAPAASREAVDAHYQLLHEYTHAWTDGLLHGPIAMEDGTHDLSEGLVLLADDWLFQLCCPEELGAYRAWAGQMLDTDGPVTGEDAADMIGLGEEWQRRIEALVRTMAAG